MIEWRNVKLEEIASVQTGPFGSQLHMSDYQTVGTPIITVEHLGENRIIHNNLPLVGDEDKMRLNKYTLIEGDIVFSRVGSVDRRAYVSAKEHGWMFSGRCLRVRGDLEHVNPRFLSFYFGQESFKENIRQVAVGATMPSINTSILSEIELSIPPLPEQQAIAEVLSSIDDKIDLLHRNNKTLEEMAETIIKESCKASQTVLLGSIIEIHDNRRIPLSSIQRAEKKNGELYPYYGAASIMDYVNEYIFDGDYILLGEDGTVQTEDGYPIIQRLNGKAWVNNHAHVISALKPYNNDLLEVILKNTSISHIVTGAVQPKINQGSLKNLEIEIPSRDIEALCSKISTLLAKRKNNIQSIEILTKTRDTLIPKLMSGQVRVKN
jgi:restriction endonuclease S subunit